MYKNWTYKEAISKADSLHNIGENEIYLYDDINNLPWDKVIECRPGGSHRLDISTDVWFKAFDENTRLFFKWTFEIENISANGNGYYEINIEGCNNVMKKISGQAKIDFINYLSECSNKIAEKGKEWNELANRQLHDAAILRSLFS